MLKSRNKGFNIEEVHKFNMWMKIPSCPWASLGSKYRILLVISLLKTSNDEILAAGLKSTSRGHCIKNKGFHKGFVGKYYEIWNSFSFPVSLMKSLFFYSVGRLLSMIAKKSHWKKFLLSKSSYSLVFQEVVAQKRSVKKVFLEILQIS